MSLNSLPNGMENGLEQRANAEEMQKSTQKNLSAQEQWTVCLSRHLIL